MIVEATTFKVKPLCSIKVTFSGHNVPLDGTKDRKGLMEHPTIENIMISESYYKSLRSDLAKLIDTKFVDPKLVAARLCAISLEISPPKSDDAMYCALKSHDFADEIVSCRITFP